MTAPTSAGWYTDPDDADQLRYFDGVVWTAHRTPLRSPTAAASTIGRPHDVVAHDDPARRQAGGAPYPTWSTPPARLPAPGSVLPDGAVLAEWWRRLLARVIDWFLTSVVSTIASLPFVGPLLGVTREFVDDVVAGRTPDQDAFFQAVADAAVPVTLVGLVVAVVYETVFLVRWSATPGKMLLGTVVRPAAAPGRVTLLVAIRRQLIDITSQVLGLSVALAFFGTFLSVVDPAWLLWDRRRQCLHDKVADTVVVLKRP